MNKEIITKMYGELEGNERLVFSSGKEKILNITKKSSFEVKDEMLFIYNENKKIKKVVRLDSINAVSISKPAKVHVR